MRNKYIKLLVKAIELFYQNDAKELFGSTKDVDERAMVGCVYRYMWCMMQQPGESFSVPNIDIEYDRMGNNLDAIKKYTEMPSDRCKKCDRKKICYDVLKSCMDRKNQKKTRYEFRPDIILHQRGTSSNGLVVEFKKRRIGTKLDIAKLSCCTCYDGEFKYDIGAFVLLEKTQAHIKVFINHNIVSWFKVNSEGRCEYNENEKVLFDCLH